MELTILLPLLAFVALGALASIVLRRAGRVLTETRDADRFKRGIADLAARVETSLGGVSERIDSVRRQQETADTIETNLAAAVDAVRRYAGEAKELPAPPSLADLRVALIEDLERTARALQMVEHGCSILASARPGGRELEAQTAIKRGYLNILHAREAIGRHAAEASERPIRAGRRSADGPSAPRI